MQVDIAGRVKNLQVPLTQPCVPLFECLVNSIEAIEAAGIADGRIAIKVHRDTTQTTLDLAEEQPIAPVKDITVIDNGVGFDDANARAFFLSDSTAKLSRGNKGVGRFTWLKVFDRAHIDSVYRNEGSWAHRCFSFVRTADGIEDDKVEDSSTSDRKTTVHLIGLQPEYQKHFPKALETIGHKILDHLLIYFVTGKCPEIVLSDDAGSFVNLRELFAEEARYRSEDKTISVRNETFQVRILRYHSSAARQHTVSYCANGREVIEWNAGKVLPDLSAKIKDGEGSEFVFKTYVSGPYLDARVNSERTSIQFLPANDLDFPNELTQGDLDQAVIEALRSVAGPYMASTQQEKRLRVERFVQQDAPQYRPLLNSRYQERVSRISAHLTDQQLDVELYKVQRDVEVEHRQKAAVLAQAPVDDQHAEEYAHFYEQYLDEENELGKAALAKYVVHRRTILELLDRALKLQATGSYAKEDFVHKLIYPMQSSSEDVAFERQNLWVVDERLAYHGFLASDTPLRKLRAIQSAAMDEPDLVVFNVPRVFVDGRAPYGSIVILEFKRPERNEYPSKDEDPVEQVLRYVSRIKEGTVRDVHGKTLNVGQVPFYAHILCSLTPKIRQIMAERDFIKTPDNEGFFLFHKNSGCYIEVTSYDKLLSDAQRRNRAFFERLQIPV